MFLLVARNIIEQFIKSPFSIIGKLLASTVIVFMSMAVSMGSVNFQQVSYHRDLQKWEELKFQA
jgi:hypothetical protein